MLFLNKNSLKNNHYGDKFMSKLREYKQELYSATKTLKLKDVINHYALPNEDELHNMICGYGYNYLQDDTTLFDVAQSLDYFKYEKELWRIDKPK